MSSAGRVALAILTALAAASWWLNQRIGPANRVLEERPAAEGFYMTEAEITSAGPDGLPRYRVLADEIRQRSLRGETRLENVRVEYNIYSASPWTLTAPAGVLSADQAWLELWGGVELKGDSSDFGVAAMQTERLELDTRAHIASTASPVEFGVGPQRLHAVGMVAYLLDERVQLQSEVHGRFLP
jgi:lipopolysaccharide export system protein LptC